MHRFASECTVRLSFGKQFVFPHALMIILSFGFFMILDARDFEVLNTNDVGEGSLRAAIDSANAVSGYDTISFNIPGGSPNHIISVLSELPALEDTFGALIDGYTQPGSWLFNPPVDMWHMIVLDGQLAGDLHGLVIRSSNNTIQGLTIINFKQDGVRIVANPNGASNNHVYANSIGICDFINAMGNGVNHDSLWGGIHLMGQVNGSGYAKNNVIEGNVISANYADGIRITGASHCEVCSTVITNNYVGTCQFGDLNRGNHHSGVYIGNGAYDNSIDSCLVAGNGFDGVSFVGNADSSLYTYGNSVIYCRIGTGSIPNVKNGIGIGVYGDSIYAGFSASNCIENCEITGNNLNGIAVWEHPYNDSNADNNHMRICEMEANGQLGIDLGMDGVTYNDPGDPDTGPNQELNFPVIDTAWGIWPPNSYINGHVDIDSDPTQAVVDIYTADPDPLGYGEGYLHMGSTYPDSAGNWYFSWWYVDWVTATVTDMSGNTSEFSQCRYVIQVSVEEDNGYDHPAGYAFFYNTPNPFTDRTIIKFSLPVHSHVNLSIFDVKGSLVTTLLDEPIVASNHSIVWDIRGDKTKLVAPGVYICRLRTDECGVTRKMVVLP